MTDAKTLHFGVFEVTAPQVGGTFSWAHPRSRSADFLDPQHWIHIARVLEDAGFDFLFFAGGYGYPLVDGDLPEIAATKGINFSAIDPDYLLPLLAQHTETLGFVVTMSTGLEHPAQLARSPHRRTRRLEHRHRRLPERRRRRVRTGRHRAARHALRDGRRVRRARRAPVGAGVG